MLLSNRTRILVLVLGGAFGALLSGCSGGGDSETSESAVPATTKAPVDTAPMPAGNATISGTVAFAGQAPKLGEIDMSDEVVCATRWEEEGRIPRSEALVLGADNTLGNVFVAIKSGHGEATYMAPSDPVIIDQVGCKYVPHVFAVMKGQPVVFKNSDGVLHNVHALPNENREFNLAMPGTMLESKPRFFKKTESMFRIKCDKHPWMYSYAAVMEHPFFAVTAKDGSFEISGLAAGTYEVEAWHEKLGNQVASVTVGADEAQTVDFSFSR